MATVDTTDHLRTAPSVHRWLRIGCLAAAVGTLVPFALLSLQGETGSEITAGLAEQRTMLVIGTYVAVLVAAGLFLAAVRLGRAVPGAAGLVITAAGSGVALLYAGYYGVFGAGAVLADPATSGPGLGEAAWLSLNVMEITRYAPSLALVAAAVAAGAALPRATRTTAAVLIVMTLVPLTSWVAALLVPVWLAAAAAFTRTGSPARP